MTDAELSVYTEQGGSIDSSTLLPIIWDNNPGGLQGHVQQMDEWTDGSKCRQLMAAGVITTSGGETVCDSCGIPNIVETEREIIATFPEFATEAPPSRRGERYPKIYHRQMRGIERSYQALRQRAYWP